MKFYLRYQLKVIKQLYNIHLKEMCCWHESFWESFSWVFVFPGSRPWPLAPICIRGPRSQICISQPRPRPRPSFCVCLLFVLQLKFVIVTVSTYVSKISEISNLHLFGISSQVIFSILWIGYNWSNSVHFYFVIQLL